jgi:hypothetical protein
MIVFVSAQELGSFNLSASDAERIIENLYPTQDISDIGSDKVRKL